jgi:heat-inducible transcriptional repressor
MTQGLSERQREILCEVVELYLSKGEPVASATVSRSSSLALSSATIRNIMAELEELGLLVQPHTSAGRVPSDCGIRFYVDKVLQRPQLPESEVRRLRDKVAVDGPLEEVLAHVSRVLADTTAEVGIALVPTSGHATLRSIHFAKVSAQRVLGIVVTTGGLVDSRLLSVDRDYQPIELERISNYCSESYAGMTLEEIRSRLLALMAEERARCDDVLAGVIELGRRAVDGEIGTQGELFLEGADHLFERAAPAHLEVLPRLFAAFADKAVLLNLLNDYLAASGPLVVIGSEFALAGSDDLGLIVRSFQCESGERGLVGVIGLKRMDYPRIIPIVDFVGKRVAKVGRAAGGFDER